jgi:CheY-like chemotaxis protein
MDDRNRILVVDDEPLIRELLFHALSGRGFHVTLAKDGKESLDRMEENDFDLIITDVDMPVLDGIGLLREMKKEGRREKIIIMTGSTMDHRNLGREIPPVHAQLSKPFQIINFLEIVASALAKSRKKGAHLN